jgi:mono/diheme cytochrome c family protein
VSSRDSSKVFNWKVLFGFILLIGGLGFVGMRVFEKPAGSPGGTEVSEEDLIVIGKQVYQENCALCHGANLEGQPQWRSRKADGRLPAPPHNEEGHTWHHADKVLFEITKFGPSIYAGPEYESDMPGYKDVLSDEEIWASLAYIKSQWPLKAKQRQAMINEKSLE